MLSAVILHIGKTFFKVKFSNYRFARLERCFHGMPDFAVDFLYIRYKNSIQCSLICRLAAALREEYGLIQQHAVHAALADAPFYGCLKFTQVRILIK